MLGGVLFLSGRVQICSLLCRTFDPAIVGWLVTDCQDVITGSLDARIRRLRASVVPRIVFKLARGIRAGATLYPCLRLIKPANGISFT